MHACKVWRTCLLTTFVLTAFVLAMSSTPLAEAASATLHWTAPGDDSVAGRATTYDLRYSLVPITATNFASAPRAAGVPTPRVAGAAETFTVVNLVAGGKYYFALKTADEAANWSILSNISLGTVPTTASGAPPFALALSLPSPNPARQPAQWSYSLPAAGPVRIEIFDVVGRRVRTLVQAWQPAGPAKAEWDLTDDGGGRVAAGLYLVRARLSGRTWVQRLTVAR